MTKITPYTPEERADARELYEAADAAGKLKSPRGLFAAAFSDGRRIRRAAGSPKMTTLANARRHFNDTGD